MSENFRSNDYIFEMECVFRLADVTDSVKSDFNSTKFRLWATLRVFKEIRYRSKI